CLAGPARADQPPRIKEVRLGFPAAREGQRRLRLGAWAPVYVELQGGNGDIEAGAFELSTETTDRGAVRGRFTVPVKERTFLGWYRPANRSGEVTVALRDKQGAIIDQVTHSADFGEMLNPDEVLYLLLGVGARSGERPQLGGLRGA